ncbi:MAG: BrnA antitoxin family protein [Devosia sp.]
MKDRGELRETRDTGFREELPPGFWDDAKVVMSTPPKSVHLKVDAEVFDFFKGQGKGHLTRMQNVLRAYVRAQKRG